MVPAYLLGYVHDASLSTAASPAGAIDAYRAREHGPYAGLLGALVVDDTVLAGVVAALNDQPPGERPLEVDLVVTGGAGAIEPAVVWAGRAPALSTLTLGFALRDEEDLAHNARRLCAAVDVLEEELSGVQVFAEPPRLDGAGPSHGWLSALDELATREYGLTLRLDQPPTALAAAVDAALDRELPVRGTGATGPVSDDRTVGLLNLLLVTRAAWDGAGAEATAGLLSERDRDALLAAVREAAGALASARRWCTGVLTADPATAGSGLESLGLLDDR